MKLTRFLPIVLLFLGVTLTAQDFAKKNLEQLKNNQWLTQLEADFTHPEFFEAYAKQLGLDEHSEMRMIRAHETPNGWSHFRYQQFYKELPVLTAHYLLHEQNGDLKKANGALLPNINVPVTPSVSAKAAIEKAKVKAIRDIAAENDGMMPEGLSADGITVRNRKLAIADKRYPEWSGDYTLVHLFELDFNAMPPKHDEYFVDALSGNIIAVVPKICSGSVTGIVKTKYYGEQEVITDSIAPNQFLLRDETRGDGIITENDVTRAPFEDEDNYWDNANVEIDEVAGDAHYCATAFYDMMLEKFGWNGLDNNGHELRSRIHIGNGRSVVNAFWNGSYASFGDGNCDQYAPLTTLTVVGHEFAHGLTEFTSGLIYRNESGGLNEAMSDIFGKALAFYENPDDFNWKIGYDFLKDSTVRSFRDMSNPNDYGDPKFYLGNNWSYFGSVHTNSGVLNYWFHMLVEGEQGINEEGLDYNVGAIGMDKAIQIAFGTETSYLTPSSTYQDCMLGTLQVTEELYGATSVEMAAVLEAWKAVGVNYSAPYTLPLDFEITVLKTDSIFCNRDEPINITVQLKNLSIGNITPGTVIELGYFLTNTSRFSRQGEQVENFTISETLLPGDSVQFTFTELLNLSNASQGESIIVGYISDNNTDDYKFNNTDDLSIQVAQAPGVDIEFSISSVSVSTCNPTSARVSLQFRNVGCTVLDVGTQINSVVKYEGVDYQFETVLDDPFMPWDYEFDFQTIDLPELLTGNREVTTYLDFPADMNLSNNFDTSSLRMYQEIEIGYEEDFSDYSTSEDAFIKTSQVQSFTQSRVVEYQGNKMLGFAAERPTTLSSFAETCPTLAKTILDNTRNVSRLNICQESSGINNPIFSFDMVKFAFANSLDLDPKHSALVQVFLPNDNNFEPIYIYDQDSGQIERHFINLPSNYSGDIQMNIFTVLGNPDILENGQFDQGDVILIDNIQFTDGFTDVSEVSENQSFTVSPNPSSGIFQFENFKALPGEFDIQIFDPFGKKVGQLNDVTYRTSWSAETVASGVYYYKITQQNELVDYGKLVVQK